MSRNKEPKQAQSTSKEQNALEKAKQKHKGQQQKKIEGEKRPPIGKRLVASFADFDGKIFILYGLLLTIGLLMVTTASSYLATTSGNPSYYYLMRQGIFAVVGFIAIIFIYFTNAEMWRHKGIQAATYGGMTLLLLATVIFGETINGAQGWLGAGSFSIQPVEFAKPALIILMANFLARDNVQNKIAEVSNPLQLLKTYWKPLLAIGLWIGMVLTFPDVGGVLILISLMIILILNSGMAFKWLFRTVVIAFGIYLITYIGLHLFDLSHIDNYQIQRFTSFINPFNDAQDAGMQLVYGYYALSNGGILGRGAGNSIQKLGYLPEAHNDFIMAIIGEEFGIWGIALVLVIYFALIVYIFYKAVKMRRIYDQLLLVGVGAYFLIQALVNLGGILGLIPLTGVTFPFMSYGGSSLLVSSIMIGIVLSVIRSDRTWRRTLHQERAKKS